MRQIYTLFHYLAVPGILARLLWRSRHLSGYRMRWNERFGYIPHVKQDSIWIHAVSVGETIAAVPLIKALINQYPHYKIIVTSTTPTGSAQVVKHFQDQVMHVYAPYDVPFAVNRFLRRVKPKLCIIMETELWPNLLHSISKKQIPAMLANARISEKSRRGYQLISPITKKMLASFQIIAAQGLLDAERLLLLGSDPKKVTITGNIKFDMELPNDIRQQGKVLRESWQATNRPVFIVASTHEGEDEIILKAFTKIRKTIPELLMVLVPRHPERFEKVGQMCEQAGFKIAKRSIQSPIDASTDIMLGDTMGELRMLYAACDVAFVGGSFAPIGGHNLIEPAIIGLPVLTGPHVHNFTEITRLLQDAGAAQIVKDADALASNVNALFNSDEIRNEMGRQAQQVIAHNSGALQKHLDWIVGQVS